MLSDEPIYLAFSQEAKKISEWEEYSEYCLLRDKGLRKQAFLHLNKFLKQTLYWSFEERKCFVIWLYKMNFLKYFSYALCPRSLKEELIQPLLEEWISKEPENTEALLLMARPSNEQSYELYNKVISIEPNNQDARFALAGYCIDDIEYSTHELPYGFLGDPDEMLDSVKEAEGHISCMEEGDRKECLVHELRKAEQLLRDWITFEAEEGNDFASWCKKKGRHYRWLKAYYYGK